MVVATDPNAVPNTPEHEIASITNNHFITSCAYYRKVNHT